MPEEAKKPAHRPSKKPANEELARLYQSLTQPEMAKYYGVSIRTVARWLHMAGCRKT